MMYKDLNTGELWTREEIEKEFNDFRHEMEGWEEKTFEEYLEDRIRNNFLAEAKRNYVIADCKDGDLFFEKIETDDKEKAIEIFRQTWDALLSDHDKKHRDYFELLYAYGDGDAADIETAELVEKIK